jgi:hypothetical protein
MKKPPRYVPSVVRLSEAIGLSRQWTQELMRLQDAPRVTKQGHDVAAWKDYVTKRASKIQAQAGQKAKLQIDLLQARLAREAHDLAVASGEVRESIAQEILGRVMKCFHMLVAELDRIPGDLPPQLVGQSASEMRKLLKARLEAARSAFVRQIESVREREMNKGDESKANVIPFERAKAASQ